MNIKSTLLLILSALVLSLSAQAKPQKGEGKRPEPGAMFSKLDTDGSGTLSTDEVEGRMAERFAEIDANSDGELTQEELKAAHEARRGQRNKGKAKEADTDENGAISLDEAEAAGMERLVENFDQLDGDGNGEISREEFQAARESRKASQE